MNTADVHLSKCLSWLLRHGAIKEGLPIGPGGYLPLDVILQHKSLKQYTKEDIFRVVETNAKKRFTLKCNSDKWEIKANQGHSIAQVQDTELTPINEPIYKTVIHGTYYKCWPQIKEQGLCRMDRNHMHFSKGLPKDKGIVSGVRTNTEIYIYIDLKKALSDGLKFYESANEVILTRGDKRGYLSTKYFEKVVDAHTGYPDHSNRSDLKLLFSKYGSVTVEHMNGKMAVLRYCDPNAVAEVILDRNIFLHGKTLRIKPYSGDHDRRKKNSDFPKRDFTKSKLKNEIIDPEKLELSGDFHDQLDIVLDAVRLNQLEVNSLARLFTDIEYILQELWPGCITHPFGSITTGLGIKSSDADCYVSGAGRGDQSSVSVNKAKKLFEERPDLFTEILAIPRANTPIVKLFHIPTQTNCDISFKTSLGTQNSKLIAFLLQSDAKLIPISVLIKYWGKVHGLTGTGRLSNYALTMLVIFYLQQPPLNMLPAVLWLQNVSNRQIVDGWNTGFAELLLPRENMHQLSLPQLLAGFFEFYAKFDFKNYIVCPYLGRPIEKEMFNKPECLPEEFAIYKRNVRVKLCLPLKVTSAICVQDPFEQCHNVASTVSNPLANEIKAYFEFATEAYENDKKNDCEDFLKHILLLKPKFDVVPKKKNRGRKLILRLKLRHELYGITNPDWKSVVRKAVYLMFEKMLKIKLVKVGETITQDIEKDRYKAGITRAVWRRGQFDKVYKYMKFGFLEREQRITEEIIHIDKHEIHLPIIVRVFIQKDTRSCHVLVTPGNKDIKKDNYERELFQQFISFGRSIMYHWFVDLLRVCNTNTEYYIAEANGDCDSSSTSEDSDSEDELLQPKQQPKVWHNTKHSESNSSITSVKNLTKNSKTHTNIRNTNSDSAESTKTKEPDNKQALQDLKINKQNTKKLKKLEGNVSLLGVRKVDTETDKAKEVNQHSIDQVKEIVQIQPGPSTDYTLYRLPHQHKDIKKDFNKNSEENNDININIKDCSQTGSNNSDNLEKQNENQNQEKQNKNQNQEKKNKNHNPEEKKRKKPRAEKKIRNPAPIANINIPSCENSIKHTDDTTTQNKNLVIESTNIVDDTNCKDVILKLNSTDIGELSKQLLMQKIDQMGRDPIANRNINEVISNQNVKENSTDSTEDSQKRKKSVNDAENNTNVEAQDILHKSSS